ncbi:MAG: hypothetical protein IJQ16_07760 [Selenomonadaceae bacterium]|nr:hypothetical protein [Selenomonadaceae bacterium]
MKVYDCFTFFNEFELLELRLVRLDSLWNLVDYFVIVEANKTHANEPKPFNFLARQKDFKKYFKKIRYVMDDSIVPYKGVGDWSIENNQRNNIIQGLGDAEPDDLIFISDVDEFPNPATIKTLLDSQFDKSKNVELIILYYPEEYSPRTLIPCLCQMRTISFLNYSPIVCWQDYYCYYLNWVSRKLPLEGTVIGKFKHMKTPQDFRNARRLLPRLPNGGWHFSYMGGVDKVITKMQSAVECVELVDKDKKYIDRDFVSDAMAKGIYFGSKAEFSRCNVDEINLPTLKNFLKKYPYFVSD